MTEGPDVARNVALPPPEPDRRDQREAEAARRDLLRETIRTRRTVVTAIAVATSLILAALGYQRCSDPWWRCKRLADAAERPFGGLSDADARAWDELGCDRWPGV